MIYITCPVNTYTGGPTLAHQLCYILNSNGIDSKMLYDGKIKKGESPVHKNYEHFKNPYVLEINETKDDIIIILETKVTLINRYPLAKKYIWWMSVDNYFVSKLTMKDRILRKLGKYSFDMDTEKKKRYLITKKMLSDVSLEHLVQSEYAKLFLEENDVGSEKIHYLTDYIEDEVYEYGNIKNKNRKNVVLYNPKKGFEFTKKIMESMNENIVFIPLINMSKSEVVNSLCNSKLYIDFGNHPGKDRFPREAVTCGCCIITGKRGAAANNVDIPIPSKYKFEDNEAEINNIIEMIKFIMKNYDKCYNDFNEYRMKISHEKKAFETEAIRLFS